MTDWLLGVAALLATLVGPGDTAAECLLLGRVDAVRVVALTASRPDLLDDVYGAADAARTDRRLLATYTQRRLSLRGAALHRLRCEVVDRGRRRIRFAVVERLGATWVADDGGRRRELPRPAARRRTVTLDATADGWRIVQAR